MTLLTRTLTTRIAWLVDNLLPPIIRDSAWFSWLLLYPVTGRTTPLYVRFKDEANALTPAEFRDRYARATVIPRATDLGRHCLRRLTAEIHDTQVLEVGCGNGTLARGLAARNRVTACDIHIRPGLVQDAPGIAWAACLAEHIPFADASFDVVVCTHTLEHVRDLGQALAELRRIARRRLYIVVPLQRPYRVTPDLHLWFFPYPHSFINQARPTPGSYRYEVLDRDLFYCEDRPSPASGPVLREDQAAQGGVGDQDPRDAEDRRPQGQG